MKKIIIIVYFLFFIRFQNIFSSESKPIIPKNETRGIQPMQLCTSSQAFYESLKVILPEIKNTAKKLFSCHCFGKRKSVKKI